MVVEGVPTELHWAPPEAEVADVVQPGTRLVLATPTQRLVAVVIDFVAINAIGFFGMFAGGFVAAARGASNTAEGQIDVFGGGAIATIAWLAFQATLLHRGSWTLGKLIVRIRIRRRDGRRAGLARTFLVRMLSFNLLVVVAAMITFFIGAFILVFVDGALVYSLHRRSLKDRLAGTIVVQA